MKPPIVDKKKPLVVLCYWFFAHSISHIIFKSQFLLFFKMAPTIQLRDFFSVKRRWCSTAAVLALACKQKYDGSISYPVQLRLGLQSEM